MDAIAQRLIPFFGSDTWFCNQWRISAFAVSWLRWGNYKRASEEECPGFKGVNVRQLLLRVESVRFLWSFTFVLFDFNCVESLFFQYRELFCDQEDGCRCHLS